MTETSNKLIEQCIQSLLPTDRDYAWSLDSVRALLDLADRPHVVKEIRQHLYVSSVLSYFSPQEPRFQSEKIPVPAM